MTKIPNSEKKKLIGDFEMMKSVEESAEQLYTNICLDKRVKNETVKETFRQIAEDEKRHVQIVQKIINIIDNCC